MTMLAKPQTLAGASPAVDELSAQALLDALSSQKGKKLIFNYDGLDVKPSYHVTEVKTGAFSALDCGANPEAWSETFIQLWDIEEDSLGHMQTGKFLAIIAKVGQAVGFDANARLTFEVSDGVRPMQLYRAEAIAIDDAAVRVRLSPRPSSCKPRDRWLQQETAQSGCGASAKAKTQQPCCG